MKKADIDHQEPDNKKIEVSIYEIVVSGCDGFTEFEMELTKLEYEIIKKVAERCTITSDYSCMPKMRIEEL